MAKMAYIVSGPNLDARARREPATHDSLTLDRLGADCQKKASARGSAVAFRKSNHAGAQGGPIAAGHALTLDALAERL